MPRFSFEEPRALEVVSGKQRVIIQGPGSPDRLELLVDGRPIASVGADRTAWLDTTRLPDGLVTLGLRVRGGSRALLASAPLIVLNRGAEAFFTNGAGGTVSVPPHGVRPHQHLRYHFQMTEGVKRLLAVLTWSGTRAELELAVGQGTCPHHGTSRASRSSRSSPLAVVHAAAEGQTLPTGQWFAHVDLKNAGEVPGTETPFAVKAFLLR